MPNWCHNRVTIRAGAGLRQEIKEMLCGMQYHRPFSPDLENTPLVGHESKFCFHNVIPQPDNLLDEADPRRKTNTPRVRDEDRSMPGWYTWRCDNWGTKWEVSDVWMDESKVSLTYEFETAWAPPEQVIQALSQKFPEAYIILAFNEPGCIGKGSVHYKDGEVVRGTGVVA